MQGSFDVQEGESLQGTLGVDWNSVLVPGMDDSTQAAVRREERAHEMARQAHANRVPAPAAPAPPFTPREPHAPSQAFRLKDRLFYIIGGAGSFKESAFEARKGCWGHYIVPYYIDAQGYARPFLTSVQYPPPYYTEKGYPSRPMTGNAGSDNQPHPHMHYCKLDVDFVSANPRHGAEYWEVGLGKLKEALEKAEEMDLAFARRMEGLGNTAKSALWDCLDPDYDPTDRKPLMAQFMGKYMDRFWSKREHSSSGHDVKSLSEEALHKHREWCKAWARKHYKGLTPLVTAPAESLAGEFYPYLEISFHPQFRLTRMELARVFMRHPDIAPEFATCLHYYTTNLEQTRGGRNASYKQMSVIAASRASSYARLGNMLAEKGHVLNETFRRLASEHAFYLDSLIVDWYSVLGQMPYVHRSFDEEFETWGGWAGLRRDAADQPPWMLR